MPLESEPEGIVEVDPVGIRDEELRHLVLVLLQLRREEIGAVCFVEESSQPSHSWRSAVCMNRLVNLRRLFISLFSGQADCEGIPHDTNVRHVRILCQE